MTDRRLMDAATIRKFVRLREAIASVSLSHAETCDCTVCRAGRGDERAFAEVAGWYDAEEL